MKTINKEYIEKILLPRLSSSLEKGQYDFVASDTIRIYFAEGDLEKEAEVYPVEIKVGKDD